VCSIFDYVYTFIIIYIYYLNIFNTHTYTHTHTHTRTQLGFRSQIYERLSAGEQLKLCERLGDFNIFRCVCVYVCVWTGRRTY
jgi:hypothetical protein